MGVSAGREPAAAGGRASARNKTRGIHSVFGQSRKCCNRHPLVRPRRLRDDTLKCIGRTLGTKYCCKTAHFSTTRWSYDKFSTHCEEFSRAASVLRHELSRFVYSAKFASRQHSSSCTLGACNIGHKADNLSCSEITSAFTVIQSASAHSVRAPTVSQMTCL